MGTSLSAWGRGRRGRGHLAVHDLMGRKKGGGMWFSINFMGEEKRGPHGHLSGGGGDRRAWGCHQLGGAGERGRIWAAQGGGWDLVGHEYASLSKV